MDFLFCGIDISKDHLDFALCNKDNKKVFHVDRVRNTVTGIRTLIQQVKSLVGLNQVLVCLEHTGHYGLLLTHQLREEGVAFAMVPSEEIISSIGIKRGKSDALDAQRIAVFAATFSHRLKPTAGQEQSLLQIKALLTVRNQFVRIRTQLKNSLKALKISNQVLDMEFGIKIYQQEIANLDRRIIEVEPRIKQNILQNEAIQKSFDKMIGITGVGLITAAYVIVYTQNFSAFSNPRKFNCYCGIAPFEHSSGSSISKRAKTSRYRNRMLKAILFNSAASAIRNDQQIRTYYNRKISQGKHKLSVLNAVAGKMVYRIFAVVSRDEPFVKFSI